MPSAKAHDAITVLLAIPIFGVAWAVSGSLIAAAIISVTSLFGGLIFGPDLDTYSKQYTRWGIFRIIWFPYRSFFKHRSRWTHGILFGTLLRTIYLMGMLTVAAFLVACASAIYTNGNFPDIVSISGEWQRLGEFTSAYLGVYLGQHFAWLVFLGLWLGGVSHSLTDIAGTYVKTGKIKGML
jgi:uncharacterized metal-binding protein